VNVIEDRPSLAGAFGHVWHLTGAGVTSQQSTVDEIALPGRAARESATPIGVLVRSLPVVAQKPPMS